MPRHRLFAWHARPYQFGDPLIQVRLNFG